MHPTDQDIRETAEEVRAALEALGAAVWEPDAFPVGCCAYASEILGRILKERFDITAEVVAQDADEEVDLGGWHGGHTWLEWNGLTIDITGDQFEGWPPVIVTRSPRHHGRGEPNDRHPAGRDEDPGFWTRKIRRLMISVRPHLSR